MTPCGSATRCWRPPGSRWRPGIDFDTVDGSRFVRLSFAGPGAEIDEALDARPPTALAR